MESIIMMAKSENIMAWKRYISLTLDIFFGKENKWLHLHSNNVVVYNFIVRLMNIYIMIANKYVIIRFILYYVKVTWTIPLNKDSKKGL